MQGFRDNTYKTDFEIGFFESIIGHLIKCSSEMKIDCINTGNLLHNDENEISNRLLEKFLNKDPFYIRFFLQSPENYMPDEDRYMGITDIRAISKNYFSDSKDYYTIECKRIDGNTTLNRKYINEGVARFVVNPPKYTSRYKRNIMFGYIVKAIDIPRNTIKIEKLQNELLEKIDTSGFVLVNSVDSEYYLYSCQYQSKTDCIRLSHLFYKFADVIFS